MGNVKVKNLHKYYKKFANKHKFLTLKSAFLNNTLFTDLKTGEKFEALKGISFNVKKGTTLSVIGENGSGKSTLLKILAGISKPTSGIVETSGRISALIELGAGFHPEISGRENVFINGFILVLSKKQTGLYRHDPCVRCGKCITVCPMGLDPTRLVTSIENGRDQQALAEGAMDCIECGSCSYICPFFYVSIS